MNFLKIMCLPALDLVGMARAPTIEYVATFLPGAQMVNRGGMRDYAHKVSSDSDFNISEVRIETDDTDPSQYTEMCMARDRTVAIEPPWQTYPHGETNRSIFRRKAP